MDIKNLNLKIVDREKFAVIGKMGQGSFSSSDEWIQELWDDANLHFSEIGHLAKIDKDGNFIGFWGCMSDVNENFLPWDWQGKYMAGCEVELNAEVLPKWTKWIIPSFKYITIECNHNNYHDILDYMNNYYLPKHKQKLVGAVQEYYDPHLASIEGLYLYFPIEIL
jgi:predicted transcriptional regulator YdeE